VDFPDWRIRHVKVKIDTGARTSALDVLSYELHQDADAGLTATLRLVPKRKRSSQVKIIKTPVLGMAVVRNSNGMVEQRPLIETTIRLGPVTKRVRLTVTNRS